LILSASTPHRREKLAELFWPDSLDETARGNLRHALWQIRKAHPSSPNTFLRMICPLPSMPLLITGLMLDEVENNHVSLVPPLNTSGGFAFDEFPGKHTKTSKYTLKTRSHKRSKTGHT